MTGIEAIAAERKRQIEGEGWDPEHDEAHTSGELVRAAACYAIPKSLLDFRIQNPGAGSVLDLIWPVSWDRVWFKPKDRRRNLVRAGALIAAEIDRLDRTEASDRGGME